MRIFRRPSELDLKAEEDLEVLEEEVIAAPTFGQPLKCPECGGRGHLDRIDLRNQIQHQTCVECGHSYANAKSEFESLGQT